MLVIGNEKAVRASRRRRCISPFRLAERRRPRRHLRSRCAARHARTLPGEPRRLRTAAARHRAADADPCRGADLDPVRSHRGAGRRTRPIEGGPGAGDRPGGLRGHRHAGQRHLPPRLAHTWADTLLTPLNDSFIDLDLLARIDPDTLQDRAAVDLCRGGLEAAPAPRRAGGRPVDWVVMRNRLSSLAARNKRDMSTVLGCARQAHRLSRRNRQSRRVIYQRELFLNGLTLLDLKRGGSGPSLTFEPCRRPAGGARSGGCAQPATASCGRAIGCARDRTNHRRPASCRMNRAPNAQV